MTDNPDEIGGELSREEQALADQLESARPVPTAAFRGGLGRRLTALDPRYGPRPAHLRLIVSGYLGAGALLLAIASLQAVGAS